MGFLGIGKGPFYYVIEESRIAKYYIGSYLVRMGWWKPKAYVSTDRMLNHPFEWTEFKGKWTNNRRIWQSHWDTELFVRRLSKKELKELGVK